MLRSSSVRHGTSPAALPSTLRDCGDVVFPRPLLRAWLVEDLVHALHLIQRYLFQQFASRAPTPQLGDPQRDAGIILWYIRHTGHGLTHDPCNSASSSGNSTWRARSSATRSRTSV